MLVELYHIFQNQPKSSKLKIVNGRIVGDPNDAHIIEIANSLNDKSQAFKEAARECAESIRKNKKV
jgi:hypothetical protein